MERGGGFILTERGLASQGWKSMRRVKGKRRGYEIRQILADRIFSDLSSRTARLTGMATLYLLSNDLRIKDNPSLIRAAKDDRLTIAYYINNELFLKDRYGCRGIGPDRWRFLAEALRDLDNRLSEFGQVLHLIAGPGYDNLRNIILSNRFDEVIRSRAHDAKTRRWWGKLKSQCPSSKFLETDATTFYSQEDINFGESFPDTFSSFEKKMRGKAFRSMTDEPLNLPQAMEIESQWMPIPERTVGLSGGEEAGWAKLKDYFRSTGPSKYKETRNALHGDEYATGLSTYLAHGCLSPLQVFSQVQKYEKVHGESDSTHWIFLELFWREFFRWYGVNYKDKLFEFSGIKERKPFTSFYFENFASWRSGTTSWPIVNACMNELNTTGCLSNRGRQVVASCLVNELNIDWRCGALWFAEKLIDYDPCSNWGNWQYIAGVGADSRGGRKFDLKKQAEKFDADGQYRRRWNGK